ncbi:hypothetical protein FNV43_RR12432 [Rhamnella rubrinervis]|uniref:Uncharacterized protein n=1 Tax=Rhamnella rubrinervis TaxID=2594499 RepID=A0A8K0H7G9_9ROSA|nr:hypothetical protein FNV43_RR12432 [Rhamnella rubrinervis]
MIEKVKKNKKGSISEDDVATVLKRYSATTVLALLQEVAHCPDAKIDWNALVERTSTGITNAREYQMLWRHLAYRGSLPEKFQDDAQPLDDDSDLEFELEAFPSVNSEAATEAAACVKVLIASGLLSDSSRTNGSTVEAPLTMHIPNVQSSRAFENSQPTCPMQGTNITVPVTLLLKQPTPAPTVAEGLDVNGSAGKKKRKPWSQAEDLQLIAAVQKLGEGNWSNIAKGDFEGYRNPQQLSQRWANIRKRHGNLNIGGNTSGSQLSEAQLAARHAVSLALNMPVKNLSASNIGHAASSNLAGTSATSNLAGINSITNAAGANATSNSVGTNTTCNSVGINTARANPTNNTVGINATSNLAATNATTKAAGANATINCVGTNATSNNSVRPTFSSETPISGSNFVQAQKKSQQNHVPAKQSPLGSLGCAAKSRVISKKPPIKSTSNSDASFRAMAVAAGARIASPSDAASLLKAAQAKNAVHIMPTSGAPIKPTMPGGVPCHTEAHPNVRYMCTGMSATPVSPYPVASTGAPQTDSVKAASFTVQHTPSTGTTLLNVASKQTNEASCSVAGEPSMQEVKNEEGSTVPVPGYLTKGEIQGDGACVSVTVQNELVQEDKVASSEVDAKLKVDNTVTVENPPSSLNVMTVESHHEILIDIQPKDAPSENGIKMLGSPVRGENHSATEENCENLNRNEVKEDFPTWVADGCSEKVEILGKEEAGND